MSGDLGMFELVIVRECHWKKKPDDPETGSKRLGCERCGRAKNDPVHAGAPPSLNDGGSGMDRNAYQALKSGWHHALGLALEKAGVPRGLQSVRAEVLIGFDTYRGRDEGNFRWMIEKALGDTLVHGYVKQRTVNKVKVEEQVIAGGWLPEDTFWPELRYSMGNLQGQHTPGESWTKIMLFPSMTPPVPAPRAGDPESLFE